MLNQTISVCPTLALGLVWTKASSVTHYEMGMFLVTKEVGAGLHQKASYQDRKTTNQYL